MTSARLPRNLRQEQVVRALVRAGGVPDKAAGKGSHFRVTMPNKVRVFVPAGRIKTGTLAAIIRQAGLSGEEFDALL
jgi:predicted RNA binding protein YcfA (HicA-like mRNA interferase family)